MKEYTKNEIGKHPESSIPSQVSANAGRIFMEGDVEGDFGSKTTWQVKVWGMILLHAQTSERYFCSK